MWPWGHLAVGYLLYTGYRSVRHALPPYGSAVVALALGTQFPDVVDKPLAYWTPLLPEGRTLAHSLLVALPVCTGLLYAASRSGARARRLAGAFVVGYLAHLGGDAVFPTIRGEVDGLRFLAWPLLSPPDYEASGFAHHVRKLAESVRRPADESTLALLTDPFVVELWLVAIALVVWVRHGLPPLAAARRRWHAYRRTGDVQ